MVLRSSILIITLILICLYMANIEISFSSREMETQKEEGLLESTLTHINDNFEVGFKSHSSTVPMKWSLPHIDIFKN